MASHFPTRSEATVSCPAVSLNVMEFIDSFGLTLNDAQTGPLEITSAELSHTGRYTCTAENAAGSTHRHVQLTVQGNNTLTLMMYLPGNELKGLKSNVCFLFLMVRGASDRVPALHPGRDPEESRHFAL